MTAARVELDAGDALDKSLGQLRGLASCLVVLGEAITASGIRNELIDDALPMLGGVMMDLAQRAKDASDVLSAARQARLATQRALAANS